MRGGSRVLPIKTTQPPELDDLTDSHIRHAWFYILVRSLTKTSLSVIQSSSKRVNHGEWCETYVKVLEELQQC